MYMLALAQRERDQLNLDLAFRHYEEFWIIRIMKNFEKNDEEYVQQKIENWSVTGRVSAQLLYTVCDVSKAERTVWGRSGR